MPLPEIKAMLAAGKTQREVAEYYGFRNKQVAKKLLEREAEKRMPGGSRNPPTAERATGKRCFAKRPCGRAGL